MYWILNLLMLTGKYIEEYCAIIMSAMVNIASFQTLVS